MHYSVYQEIDGVIFDYNIFVCVASKESYLSKTEYFQVDENIEMPPPGKVIPISD